MESATNERLRIRRRATNRVQIPSFGEWNLIQQDSIPITQYFDCCTTTRQYPPIDRASVYPYPVYGYYDVDAVNDDLFHSPLYYTSPQHQPYFYNNTQQQLQLHSPSLNTRQVKGECGTRSKQQRRSRLENSKKSTTAGATLYKNDISIITTADVDKFHYVKKSSKAKARDEDLYKIPPELICKSKHKKMSKLFRKCFVTICTS